MRKESNMAEAYYNVGKIVNTHGIRGEVKVLAITDFPEKRFAPKSRLSVVQKGQRQTLTVASYRHQKTFELMTFKEIPTLTEAETIKGLTLQVAAADQQALAPGEGYYYHDIIGLTVIDQATQQSLGTVKEILSPGANDVWVVQRPQRKDWLLPYIPSVVLQVDLDAQQVMIDLPEGLIDDED
jgi:16S rRNA processing protein RimM